MNDISSVKLSPRDKLGYDYEVYVQDGLTANNFVFLGNPRQVDAWKRNVANGCDIYIIDYDIQIECKYVTVPVWASGLEYNYIPRFYSGKYKVIVTNDKKMYSKTCINKLDSQGIKVMELNELIIFLHKVINKLTPEIRGLIALLCSNSDIYSLNEVYQYFKSRRLEYQERRLVFYGLTNRGIDTGVARQSVRQPIEEKQIMNGCIET